MKPYYQDDLVTLYHGDCLSLLPTFDGESFDCVITDPPYSDRTHSNSRKKLGKTRSGGDFVHDGVTEFRSFSDETLRAALAEMGRVSSGWVIATLDYFHAFNYDVRPPDGLKMQRIGVWVKTDPTPQLTGDRPAQGWEAICYLHRTDRRSRWNGHGLHGNYTLGIDRTAGHPTAKPLSLVQDLVRKFSDRNQIILDPFAGSGTTLRAAVNEGRRAVGVEIEERYCELIVKRLAQGALDFGEAS